MLPKGCISMVFSTKHHIVQGLSKGISGQDRVRSSQQMGKGIYLFHVRIGIGLGSTLPSGRIRAHGYEFARATLKGQA